MTFPPVNGEQGVNRLGTSRLEVVSVGVGGVGGLGGCSRFPVITRIQYDGFLWGFGVETPDGYQSPGWTILGCSGGSGQFGTVSKP